MRKHYLYILLLLASAQCTTAQIYSRLVQTKTWTTSDTVLTAKESYYTYSGNRRGAADSTIQYDNWLELKRDTGGMLSDTNLIGTQLWDVHGGLIENKLVFSPTYTSRTRSVCDINGNPIVTWTEQKEAAMGDTFISYGRTEFIYNASKLIDSTASYTVVDGDYVLDRTYAYRYDAAGRQTEQYNWRAYTPPTLTPTAKNVNIYDAAGRNILDMVCPWNATKAAWDTSFGHQYYYGSTGDLDSMQYISPLGDGTWKVTQVNTYQYDAAHRMTMQTKGTISTKPFNVFYYTWEGDTIRRTTFFNHLVSTLDSAGITIEKYNAGKQLLFRENWSRSTGPWVFENATSYVYEQFTLSAATITKGNLSVDLWPVPASEQLNLHITLPSAGACTILLYDLQGKVWFVKDLPAATGIRETIPTAALPAGIYCIQIKGQQGEMAVRKITIVH